MKDVVMTPGREPLGMVRKRPLPAREARGCVLLIHGFGQNRYTWHTSRRSFSAYLVEAGYDVFNVELRGHGRSRRYGSSVPRIMDDYIREDVPRCVEEAIRLSGHDRVFLVGHSMGGLISYCAGSTTLRNRLRGMVTIGSPYRFGHGSKTLRALAKALRALRFTGIFDGNPALPLRFLGRHVFRRRLLWDTRAIPMPIRIWHPGSVEKDILDEYLHTAFDWTSLEIAFDILRAGSEAKLESYDGRTDYGAAFEHLDRPLLVVAGTEDGLAPPASVKPAFDHSRSTDKTYREFPLGHIDLIIGQQAPATVWPLVRDWLDRR